MTNLFAFTECNQIQPSYPGYVSINADAQGNVTVTVREPATTREGCYVCAHKKDAGPGRCVPGDANCNNYCNMAPEKGPMQDSPKDCLQVFEGKVAAFTIPAGEWKLK